MCSLDMHKFHCDHINILQAIGMTSLNLELGHNIVGGTSSLSIDQQPSSSWMVRHHNYRALSYYSDLTLSQEFQPMAAQLSMKAALPLAKILATASCRSSKTGPRAVMGHTKTAFGRFTPLINCNKPKSYKRWPMDGHWVKVNYCYSCSFGTHTGGFAKAKKLSY